MRTPRRLAPRRFAARKSASRKSAPSRFTPLISAPRRRACHNTAFVITANSKSAPTKLAASSCAVSRLAPDNRAPPRSAPVKQAPLKSAPIRFALCRLAHARLAFRKRLVELNPPQRLAGKIAPLKVGSAEIGARPLLPARLEIDTVRAQDLREGLGRNRAQPVRPRGFAGQRRLGLRWIGLFHGTIPIVARTADLGPPILGRSTAQAGSDARGRRI